MQTFGIAPAIINTLESTLVDIDIEALKSMIHKLTLEQERILFRSTFSRLKVK